MYGVSDARPSRRSGVHQGAHQRLELLNKLKGASSAELKRSFTDYGLNKLVFAWNPEYIPYANPTKLPTDLLHLGGDGLLRSEGAWMFYIFGRMGLCLKKFNARLRGWDA